MLRNTKIAPKSLPPGIYLFKIVAVEAETDAKKGHDLLKVKLATINLEDESSSVAHDRFPFIDEMIWKLGNFLVSTGYPVKEDNTIDWNDAEMVGKEGFLLSEEKTVNEKKYMNYHYLAPDDYRVKAFLGDAATPNTVALDPAPAKEEKPEAKVEVKVETKTNAEEKVEATNNSKPARGGLGVLLRK